MSPLGRVVKWKYKKSDNVRHELPFAESLRPPPIYLMGGYQRLWHGLLSYKLSSMDILSEAVFFIFSPMPCVQQCQLPLIRLIYFLVTWMSKEISCLIWPSVCVRLHISLYSKFVHFYFSIYGLSLLSLTNGKSQKIFTLVNS